MILRPCLDCGKPAKGSRCEPHQKVYDAERRARYRPLGRPWRRKRDAVLKAEPFCRYCGQPSEEADHVVARARGGGDDRSNLQGLCFKCNRAKGAKV